MRCWGAGGIGNLKQMKVGAMTSERGNERHTGRGGSRLRRLEGTETWCGIMERGGLAWRHSNRWRVWVREETGERADNFLRADELYTPDGHARPDSPSQPWPNSNSLFSLVHKNTGDARSGIYRQTLTQEFCLVFFTQGIYVLLWACSFAFSKYSIFQNPPSIPSIPSTA